MDNIQDDEERRGQLKAEADAVLQDASFRRSPTLSALLRYLVSQTIAGRGEDLKSYTIAVDGLGRSEDFDPTSDSSARVQMIRLRKALESYYAKNAHADRLCIFLQPGSYVVRIAMPSVAYPALYRPSEDTRASTPAKLAENRARTMSPRPYPSVKSEPGSENGLSRFRKWRGSAGVAAGILIAALGFFGFQYAAKPFTASLSPVVSIKPISTGDDPQLTPLAESLRNAYESHLPRFKTARVRISSHRDTAQEQTETYRLNTRIVAAGNAQATLYISLDESSTDTVIWTQSVVLSTSPAEASRQIMPLLGDIMGPAGTIALHQTVSNRNSAAGGYPCMLKYFEFIRTRDPRLETPLEDCLQKPVKEQGIAASLLGMRAMFEIERPGSRQDTKSAIRRASLLARQAVKLNPTDAWANFAMATSSYFAKDCQSAIVYTNRTLEQNSISPVFGAALAALSPSCNHPDAGAILDQALLVQSPLYDRARLLLVFSALTQNRIDKIAEIKQSVPPETAEHQRFYYATEAVISASKGRSAEASRHWKTFSALTDPRARTADQKLASVMVFPEWRKKVLEFLKKSGVSL